MLHASYFEEPKTCLCRGPMYDVSYVFIMFPHTEKHVLAELKQKTISYAPLFWVQWVCLMKLMAAHLNVKQKRVHGRASLISHSSESSPVVGKPSFSVSLFSTPSLD